MKSKVLKLPVTETSFAVRGEGRFPVEMLAFDRCCPMTEADARLMAKTEHRQLQMLARNLTPGAPNASRWRSFGWAVVTP